MTPEQAHSILNTTIQSYETVAEEFGVTRVFPWPESQFFEAYLKPGMRVADIGSANGRMVGWVTQHQGCYVGIEPARSLLQSAQTTYPKEQFLLGALPSLPLEDQSVDMCLLNGTLHHLPSPLHAQALEEIHRVLTLNGFVCMVNWNLWQPRFFMDHLKEWGKQCMRKSNLDWKDIWIPFRSPDKTKRVQRFYHGFTQHELQLLAQENHFSILQQAYAYKNSTAGLFTGRNLVSVWQKLH